MTIVAAVDVIPLPSPEVLIARVLVTGLLVVLYAYDWWQVLARYRRPDERRRDGSGFRALVKSTVLMIGLFVVFVGSINGAFFADEATVREALRFVGNVLLGMLIVGGLALVGSWRGKGRVA